MNDDRIKALEEHTAEFRKEITELKIELAKITSRQDAILEKVDKYSSGINRGLWLLGGGFILSLVNWVMGGGIGQ